MPAPSTSRSSAATTSTSSRSIRWRISIESSPRIPGEPEGMQPYWRDVGTIDSYFTSNMELRARVPALDLYNRSWRIRSAQRDYPPARFVRAGEGHPAAQVDDSLVCEGSILASA